MGYNKLDLTKLNYADELLTQEEAQKGATPLIIPDSVLDGAGNVTVNSAEKDYDNKCVKLAISL